MRDKMLAFEVKFPLQSCGKSIRYPDLPVAYSTKTTTQWFPPVGERVPGYEVTIRGDGSYDGHYEMTREVWLIERSGKRSEHTTFHTFWHALAPTEEELTPVLANASGELLHLLRCGLGCGRPITRHPLWDGMGEVAKYRDHQFVDGILSFYVYECGDFTQPGNQHRIARIDFTIADGTCARSELAVLKHRWEQK
jgi:hypothetical protein